MIILILPCNAMTSMQSICALNCIEFSDYKYQISNFSNPIYWPLIKKRKKDLREEFTLRKTLCVRMNRQGGNCVSVNSSLCATVLHRRVKSAAV